MKPLMYQPNVYASFGSADPVFAGLSHVRMRGIDVEDKLGERQSLTFKSVPQDVYTQFTQKRSSLLGMTLDTPRIMGILNVTPDSFSDGGSLTNVAQALQAAQEMLPYADILDIGGESTRPGATTVNVQDELARVIPVIKAIRDAGLSVPISIDTRKAQVAAAALEAGANMVNDVSAMSYDAQMAHVVARADCPICLMHAQGLPQTMQNNPQYQHVLCDVIEFLRQKVEHAMAKGIARDKIVVDPGIGFGKLHAHNMQLMMGLSALHVLGMPVLLGVSRKRFIGEVTQVEHAEKRLPGSLVSGLHGVMQGVQILRVHDVKQTWQAVRMQLALISGGK